MENKRYHNLIRKVLQEATVDTNHPHFKEWFGKSRVTDAYGQPLKAHDSKENHFEKQELPNNFHAYPSLIPSARHHTVKHYDHTPVEQTHTIDKIKHHYYLKIENPVFFSFFNEWGDNSMLHQMYYKGLLNQEQFESLENKTPKQRTPELIKIIRSKGYDGVLYTDYNDELPHHNWVAFDKKGIKHSINKSSSNNTIDDGGGDSGGDSAGV
jgi:hypothetical protein